MTSEAEEAEVSEVAAAQSASDSGEAETIVEVTFQRNPSIKYKYLEAEPKILGVTEIALTVFFVVGKLPFYNYLPEWIRLTVVFSCVGIISGSVAIAAQKLHLPTLKACLGMQVVTCVAYALCLLDTILLPYPDFAGCWHFYNESEMTYDKGICIHLEKGLDLLDFLNHLTETTQIVLSVTLAAYCCKVIPCCSPRSHVPVFVMTSPAAPQ